MKVKLVSYSKPAEELETHGIADVQELIAYCANVSDPTHQYDTETSDELIKHLIHMQHWGPLEMVHACLQITTTRDISRQMCRHRSFSFEEVPSWAHLWWSFEKDENTIPDLNFYIREARFQDINNVQLSVGVDPSNAEQKEIGRLWEEKQQAIITASREAYTWAVSNGIDKSQARAVLPEGNTEGCMYMSGTIRSWIHYIQLRAIPNRQNDHTLIAKACAEAIAKIFPLMTSVVPNKT
jgi:thymidylate synthase (FAD)